MAPTKNNTNIADSGSSVAVELDYNEEMSEIKDENAKLRAALAAVLASDNRSKQKIETWKNLAARKNEEIAKLEQQISMTHQNEILPEDSMSLKESEAILKEQLTRKEAEIEQIRMMNPTEIEIRAIETELANLKDSETGLKLQVTNITIIG